MTFCVETALPGNAVKWNWRVNMHILRKMPGTLLNVFFNYLWDSVDHVLENGFNFLWGIIIIEKVTGPSPITNAFGLAKARSWGISLLFASDTFLFVLSEKGEERVGVQGRQSWWQRFSVVPAAHIVAFPEPCHLSGKVRRLLHEGF